MEAVKGKEKKNLLIKTWERCKSISGGSGGGGGDGGGGEIMKKSRSKPLENFSKSKSWHCLTKSFKEDKKKMKKSVPTTPHQHRVAPEGCFSVYVGPERQRFVIKTEYASHPLFKMLLEDAELEYGYSSGGPLLIPCEVGLFHKVLAEMDNKEITPSCGFAYASCSPFNPPLRLGGGNKVATKGYGSYGLLTPPRLLKLNQF